MPLFTFVTRGTDLDLETSVELPDADAARIIAVRYATDLLPEVRGHEASVDTTVSVNDSEGLELLTVMLSVSDHRAALTVA